MPIYWAQSYNIFSKDIDKSKENLQKIFSFCKFLTVEAMAFSLFCMIARPVRITRIVAPSCSCGLALSVIFDNELNELAAALLVEDRLCLNNDDVS